MHPRLFLVLLAAGCADSSPTHTLDDTDVVVALVSAPPAPFRRLSQPEWLATIGQALPHVSLAGSLPPEQDGASGMARDAQTLTVSGAHVDAWEALAVSVGQQVGQAPADHLPCAAGTLAPAPGATCEDTDTAWLAEQLLARPISPSELATLSALRVGVQRDGSPADGWLSVVMSLLLDPELLYLEAAPQDAHAAPRWVARRLATMLWAQGPDRALLDAAASGAWKDEAKLREAVDAMLDDPRAERAMAELARQWLELDNLDPATLDATTYGLVDAALAASLTTSATSWMARVVLSPQGTLSDLLLAPEAWVDAPTARVFGVPAPDAPWGLVALPPEQRAGILTHPAFLTIGSGPVHPSPVQRGRLIHERLMCGTTEAPPASADTTPPTEANVPGATNRARYESKLSPPSCRTCHEVFTPPGYALEHYDSLGRWRDRDPTEPVDATITFRDQQVSGGVELADALLASDDVTNCVVRTFFRWGWGRRDEPGDAEAIRMLREVFEASGQQPRALLTELAVLAVRDQP